MKRPAIDSLLPCFAVAIAAVLAPGPLHATGDYAEEPLAPLSDLLKLDQLPAKTLQQLHDEMGKPAPKAEKVDVEKEVAGFKSMTPAQVVARIDQLVPQARATQDTPALNLLNDLRDLHAGRADAAEIADYLAWRTAKPAYELAEIEGRMEKASPALLPHFIYLRGAAFYHDQQFEKSVHEFERLLKEFPEDPRAEVALFMSARCHLVFSRAAANDNVKGPEQRALTKRTLEEYLAKYPKGRWAGDALGWLGAWHWDGNDLFEALKCYLGQLDYPEHPELASSALQMCEKILSFSASEPKEEDWAAIAKHPIAAQALVYLVCNTAEANNYDGKFDPVDEVKAWRKKVLPQIATAIAGQEALYKDATWRPRYLSTLALAASGAGNQDEALKLLDAAGPDATSDDLLLARGVVAQRARRNPDAVTAFRSLIERFPASPLARGACLRLGLALADDHQAGQAVLELDPLLVKAPDARPPDSPRSVYEEEGHYPIYSDVPDQEVRQLADLWLNFAPIEELAAPASAPGIDPVKRLRLTEPIAQRLLAKEQFEEAKKYLTPAQYQLFAGPLEKLTAAARAAKDPATHAAACLALGDAWAAARGKLLTYPLDSDENRKLVYPEDAYDANSSRTEAAATLGYTGNYSLNLENRDELRHAFNWWLEASDAKRGTAATATALWRALRAMPLIASVSSFTFKQAIARDWTTVALKLDHRLHTECSNSVEAKRSAVAWNFSEPKPDARVHEDGASDAPADGSFWTLHALGIKEHEWREDGDETRQLTKLVHDAGTASQEVLKANAAEFRDAAEDKFIDLYGSRWVNCFDDLAEFFSEPPIPGAVRERYVQMRAQFHNRSAVGSDGEVDGSSAQHPDVVLQKGIASALADPQTKPVADYFEFLNLAVIANHFVFRKETNVPKSEEAEILEQKNENTYRTHDYPLLAAKARAFLSKYPKSRKREAALLLEARAVFRASEQKPVLVPATWPQLPAWDGGFLTTLIAQEPFDAKRVRAALDAYDREFPKGRYTADIRDYRAAVAFRLHEWKPALEMTVATLQEPRVDLHGAAGRRLGALFALLADERYRADLVPIIKANPHGRELLLKYLDAEGYDHPLRCLSTWLRGQVAKR